MFFAMQGVPVVNANLRFTDSSAVIADGYVLATPVDSNEVHCLKLADGTLCWTEPRQDDLYLACVRQQTVVLVGRQGVRALRLAPPSKEEAERAKSEARAHKADCRPEVNVVGEKPRRIPRGGGPSACGVGRPQDRLSARGRPQRHGLPKRRSLLSAVDQRRSNRHRSGRRPHRLRGQGPGSHARQPGLLQRQDRLPAGRRRRGLLSTGRPAEADRPPPGGPARRLRGPELARRNSLARGEPLGGHPLLPPQPGPDRQPEHAGAVARVSVGRIAGRFRPAPRPCRRDPAALRRAGPPGNLSMPDGLGPASRRRVPRRFRAVPAAGGVGPRAPRHGNHRQVAERPPRSLAASATGQPAAGGAAGRASRDRPLRGFLLAGGAEKRNGPGDPPVPRLFRRATLGHGSSASDDSEVPPVG